MCIVCVVHAWVLSVGVSVGYVCVCTGCVCVLHAWVLSVSVFIGMCVDACTYIVCICFHAL